MLTSCLAQTGFEFRQRRANPVMTGIVVAAEMADTLMGAIIEMEQAAEEKEFVKLQQRCLKRWKTLILGLRIRQRVNASYSNTGKDKSAAPSKSGKSQVSVARARLTSLRLAADQACCSRCCSSAGMARVANEQLLQPKKRRQTTALPRVRKKKKKKSEPPLRLASAKLRPRRKLQSPLQRRRRPLRKLTQRCLQLVARCA